MSLVVLQSVSLGFGKKQLVEQLDLRVGRHDRIGLCGPNGSGKSSLMKILAGQLSPDQGDVHYQKNLRIGHLTQDIPQGGGKSVIRTVLDSVPGRTNLEQALARAEADLESSQRTGDEEGMMSAAEWIADLHEEIANFELYHSEHEARRILAGLGFGDGQQEREISELSGGWRMRALLAGLLFQRPELLLLDEPTNHLDLPSVAWFSEFLRTYGHAFVLISHDREFLNEQIDRVVSLEPEGVRQYRGNWEEYQRQRAEEEIVLENQAKNLQRERDKAEQFITRFRAQANKAKAVQSRIKQLEKMDQVQTFARRKVMQFRFPASDRTGDTVLKVEKLRKAYGSHVVLDGVDLHVARGEKIGIIGVNGAGKTTLLRTIAGEIPNDGGSILLGHNVKVGYYAQHHADTLHASNTIFDEIASHNRGAGATQVRTLLGAFMFSDDDVEKPVSVLSGGERARVALARLLIAPGNFILMDEPTNHLDLDSSESLAESLSTFDGTLLFVSHNRSFIRKLATQIWNVENGKVERYPGTLDEYIDRHRGLSDGNAAPKLTAATPAPAARTNQGNGPGPAEPTPRQDPAKRVDRKAQKREEAQRRSERNKKLGPVKRRIEELERKIEALEADQRKRNLELADADVYHDPKRREPLLTAYQRDAAALADLAEAWEAAQLELEAAETD